MKALYTLKTDASSMVDRLVFAAFAILAIIAVVYLLSR
jgi:hypothetical protein